MPTDYEEDRPTMPTMPTRPTRPTRPTDLTARQAAARIGVNERTIRRWIARGQLTAHKVAVNRYQIAASDLPPAPAHPRPAAHLSLAAQVKALHQRVTLLETLLAPAAHPKTSPDALRGDSEALAPEKVIGHHPTVSMLPESPLSASFRRQSVVGVYHTVAQADHFLARHGVGAGTAKGWGWLREAVRDGLTATTLIARTRGHLQAIGHRRHGMTLTPCGDATCPCHDLLAPSAPSVLQ